MSIGKKRIAAAVRAGAKNANDEPWAVKKIRQDVAEMNGELASLRGAVTQRVTGTWERAIMTLAAGAAEEIGYAKVRAMLRYLAKNDKFWDGFIDVTQAVKRDLEKRWKEKRA